MYHLTVENLQLTVNCLLCDAIVGRVHRVLTDTVNAVLCSVMDTSSAVYVVHSITRPVMVVVLGHSCCLRVTMLAMLLIVTVGFMMFYVCTWVLATSITVTANSR